MQRWSRVLRAVNKSPGKRWSPIPKPPPPHIDRLCGTHCVLNTLRVFYTSVVCQHPHRQRLHRLFVRDFRLAMGDAEMPKTETDNDVSGSDCSTSNGIMVPPQYHNLRRIVWIAQAMQVKVQCVERRELVQLCGERRNQNVVLEVSSYKPKEVVACPWPRSMMNSNNNDNVYNWEKDSVSHAANDDVLFLDHVVDPNNVGAIMRSAFFFGLRSIVLSNDSAACTAAVARASAGFMEYMCVYRSVVPTVRFLENTVAQFKARREGYKLEIYAATTTPLRTMLPLKHGGMKEKTEGSMRRRLLLLGNEDKGLSLDVIRLCTHAVHVPSLRQRHLQKEEKGKKEQRLLLCQHNTAQQNFGKEEAVSLRPQEVSLNVSAASAIILAALLGGDKLVEMNAIY